MLNPLARSVQHRTRDGEEASAPFSLSSSCRVISSLRPLGGPRTGRQTTQPTTRHTTSHVYRQRVQKEIEPPGLRRAVEQQPRATQRRRLGQLETRTEGKEVWTEDAGSTPNSRERAKAPPHRRRSTPSTLCPRPEPPTPPHRAAMSWPVRWSGARAAQCVA